MSRNEEEKLLGEIDLYQDPLLVDYLEQVVTHLNPESMADNPELRYTVGVVEDPTLNAFAFPHGALYIHTGLLARMSNEDQLATVLGCSSPSSPRSTATGGIWSGKPTRVASTR